MCDQYIVQQTLSVFSELQPRLGVDIRYQTMDVQAQGSWELLGLQKGPIPACTQPHQNQLGCSAKLGRDRPKISFPGPLLVPNNIDRTQGYQRVWLGALAKSSTFPGTRWPCIEGFGGCGLDGSQIRVTLRTQKAS